MGKYIGYGATVKVSTSTTVSNSSLATAVGHLVSWGGLSAPVPKIDIANIDDAAASCEPGQPDVNEGSFILGYTLGDTGHRKLIQMRKNRTKGYLFLIPASTAGVEENFKMFVSNIGLESFDKTNRITRSVSIQPTSGVGWSTS